MAVVEVENVVKEYGTIRALKGVSLRVEKGEVFGLLGQNGAGKTTLIKLLLGIIGGSKGKAELLGQPAGSKDALRQVGYLPEDHRFPEYYTSVSLLDFYGTLLELPKDIRRKRIPEVLKQVGLEQRMHYKIRTYSKGMKQRLGIAQALFHNPDLLFLDEPTDGVDPVGRREIRDLTKRLQSEGKTIFVNSHLLGEVEMICDRVAVLAKGTLIREGTIDSLTSQEGRFQIGLAPGQSLPMGQLQSQGYDVAAIENRWEIILMDGQSIDPVIDLIRTQGLSLRHLVEKRMTLEEAFLAAVADEGEKKN